LYFSVHWQLCRASIVDIYLPVIREQFFIVSVERAGCGKHDGSIEVTNDSAHSAGGIDTSLGAT